MPSVKIHREAALKLEEAAAWYESELKGLGSRFIDALDHAQALLSEPNPPLTPKHGQAAQLGAKKLILHKFPFSLVTMSSQDSIVVIALAHHARRPGYWRSRADT
ncbi:hypothetical protein [Parahaliea mediterranea]|uniref:Type II toxin-antitoxin system RelE/ParE family toxin n=1 Tax=Parahaliea mediterranea TaxID=651086 RepID=A0A939DDP0_9GAMM|nr:hypothetical protein [Parahaliea mediterranea]MBN7796328.1 hypothetical protein [Parahaliea mediterranea]